MDKLTPIQIVIALITGGALTAIINKLLFSKKDVADIGLELVKEMYRQHEDMRAKINEISKELQHYENQYKGLLKQHNELQLKYNTLKKDFDKLKNQTK